jgi:hypothetical protein
MVYLFRQLLFGVLVLAITASPAQFVMAFEAGQDDHATLLDCQPQPILLADTVSQAEQQTCQGDQHESCIDHFDLGCTAQFSTSFYQDSNAFYISPLSANLIKFNIDNEAVRTHYPDCIIRPPKA